jgi:hypothetical protein
MQAPSQLEVCLKLGAMGCSLLYKYGAMTSASDPECGDEAFHSCRLRRVRVYIMQMVRG